MTPLGPVPFVGRQSELDELRQHLAVVSLVSVHGPLGAGKTRLVGELAGLGVPCVIVECHLGDRASSVRASAERALRCGPGTLAQALTAQARVLVIDDIQHLRTDEATSLLSPLILGQTALGRVVVVGRDPLAAAVGAELAEVELGGLDPDAAALLWANLEETYGEAPTGFEGAFARTRGMPLGLRREFARARVGATAWEIPTLEAPARAALEALAILRQPVAPAALAALVPGVDIEAALASLLARQLVEPVGEGRVVVHEVVRVDVLAHVGLEDKRRLSASAAELVASTSALARGPRLAWQAGDDGAFGAMDQITRVREVVWHWIVAGERDRAADCLLADRELAARSGGAGEFEALLDALGDRPNRRQGSVMEHQDALVDPARVRALAALRIEIAIRGGRYTEAFERASQTPGAVSPIVHAELTLASGDVTSARRALTGLVGSSQPSDRARAIAMLAELELLAGNPTTAAHLLENLDVAGAEPLARVRVHLATARLDEYLGRVAAM
ncbi:MAG: hypothetical protein NT062_23355, partial [Proteobacteria bacterium]|nr:hypothetical protein [Pseudomonadota bacterium]